MSDGRQLVQSDEAGRYALKDVSGPTCVFVVNAPGTWPSGPWRHYLAPQSAPPSVDFGLRRQDQSGPLYFVQGTDMHLSSKAEDMYRQYVEHVNELPAPVRFVVHTGDLVIDALRKTPPQAAELYDLYERVSGDLRQPLRNVIGNHEHVALGVPDADAANPDHGKGMYLRRLGPTTYAFCWGPYHFIALDGSTLDASAMMGYRDSLDKASADWAVSYLDTLAAGEMVVLLVHQPQGKSAALERVLAALEGKRLLATLCGHGHNRIANELGGAPLIMGGAVSYAWHGFLPYPPDPWSHVIYRLEGSELEFAFLDWAAGRAIELSDPAWGHFRDCPAVYSWLDGP